MAGGKGEAIDDTEGGRLGMDGICGGIPVLVLEVGFDGPVGAEIEVHAEAGGVDGATGSEVEDAVVRESTIEVGDTATTDEEVNVGVEASKLAFDFGAEEEVHLAVDVSTIYRVSATKLEGGADLGHGQESKVPARGEAAVFAAVEVGVGSGDAAKGRKLKLPGCSWKGLRAGALRKGREACKQHQFNQGFRLLHSGFRPRFTRVTETIG